MMYDYDCGLRINQHYADDIEKSIEWARKEFPFYHANGIVEDWNEANKYVLSSYKRFL